MRSLPTPGTSPPASPAIVHFDATIRRRDKMRKKAVATGDSTSGNGQEHTPDKPSAAPVVEQMPTEQPSRDATPPLPLGATETSTTSPAVLSGQELESFLINFVVEQTGYPHEMIELDADLEADLGIDSIKKAQLFGELAEYFDIQAGDNGELSLDEFPTLRHVMTFLADSPRQGTVTS